MIDRFAHSRYYHLHRAAWSLFQAGLFADEAAAPLEATAHFDQAITVARNAAAFATKAEEQREIDALIDRISTHVGRRKTPPASKKTITPEAPRT